MLQQTRVETVIPYYERWLERFPHVQALADAPLDDVLKQWEGLGYYSRARHLYQAARIVRERHQGQIPASYDALRALPGIGAYTAGAVASIAFAQPRSAVDGNVRRVLARVLDQADPSPAIVEQAATLLLDPARPGDFNQALMELGATVCTPRAPRCESCPVESLCRARAHDTVALRPARKPAKPLPFEIVPTLIAERDQQVLLAKRPERGMLAGLWEFPAITDTDGFSFLGAVTHTFTHKRIEYRVYFTTGPVTIAGYWVEIGALKSLAFSTAQRRVARLRYTS